MGEMIPAGGTAVGVSLTRGAVGILMICPSSRLLGSVNPFTVIISSTLILNWTARPPSVSPALMRYTSMSGVGAAWVVFKTAAAPPAWVAPPASLPMMGKLTDWVVVMTITAGVVSAEMGGWSALPKLEDYSDGDRRDNDIEQDHIEQTLYLLHSILIAEIIA